MLFLTRLSFVALSLISALASSACGGSHSPDELPVVDAVEEGVEDAVAEDRATLSIMLSIAEADGFAGDEGVVADEGVVVGDDTTDLDARGIYTFDISPIPAGATILEATLRTRQVNTLGDPYAKRGPVVLDHVVLGGELAANAYSTSATPGNDGFAILSDNDAPEVKSAVVTEQVQLDVDQARSFSQYRLRFRLPTSLDDLLDVALFTDREDTGGLGAVPQLIVTYVP